MIPAPQPHASQNVLEVRFKPNARILDRRGDWVETLASKLDLPRWQIIDNRVDLFTEDRSLRAFISFRNFGYIAEDVKKLSQHQDWARKALKAVFTLPGFPTPLQTVRVGVRGRFCVAYSGSFESLRDLIVASYVAPSEALTAALGSEVLLKDIGAPLNFSDDVGNFNTHCGAMRRDQLKQFFENRDGLPEVALYYDVDYWQNEPATLGQYDLIAKVESYSKAVRTRFKQATELVLAGSALEAPVGQNAS